MFRIFLIKSIFVRCQANEKQQAKSNNFHTHIHTIQSPNSKISYFRLFFGSKWLYFLWCSMCIYTIFQSSYNLRQHSFLCVSFLSDVDLCLDFLFSVFTTIPCGGFSSSFSMCFHFTLSFPLTPLSYRFFLSRRNIVILGISSFLTRAHSFISHKHKKKKRTRC